MILMNFSYTQYLLFFALTYFVIFLDCLFSYLASLRIPSYYKAEYFPWNKYLFKKFERKLSLLFLLLIVNWGMFAIIMYMPLKMTWVVFFCGLFFTRAIQGGYRFVVGWLINGQKQ